MACAVFAAYLAIRPLPEQRAVAPAHVELRVEPVELPAAPGPLRLAGAWRLHASDRRFGGLSALAIDRGRFLAVSDRGSVMRFDQPTARRPRIELTDLRIGPGPFGRKWGRDAESLAPDPRGRGWWVGYEQRHSLWLYDGGFDLALASIELNRFDWRDNRGAEALLPLKDGLLVLAENGRDAVQIGPGQAERLAVKSTAQIAEVAYAPDGGMWVLLRSNSWRGIDQSVAPLLRDRDGYHVGPAWPLPKAALDNYEGMAIVRHRGGWRFWLVSDDGHRLMARTLLVALDLDDPPGHDKSPAPGTGLSKKSGVETP